MEEQVKVLEAYVKMMRDNGVQYLKTFDVEIVLGPQPVKVTPAADKVPPETRKAGLNSLLDHPTLQGLRPSPNE